MWPPVAAVFFLAASPVHATFLGHNVEKTLRPNVDYVPSAKTPPTQVVPAEPAAVLPDPYAVYDGRRVVKLSACSKSAVDVLMAALKDADCNFIGEEDRMQLPSKGCAVEYVICSAGAAGKLAAVGAASVAMQDGVASFGNMAAVIVNNDAGAFFRNMGGTTHGWEGKDTHAPDEFYSTYRNLDAIEKRIREVVDASGGLARLEELSPKTHEGRTIKAVRIRDAQWNSGQPRVVLTFQLHAREWITGMTGCYVVEHLIKALKEQQFTISGMEIVLVPISNPDGFVYSATTDRFWRKNRRRNKSCPRDAAMLDWQEHAICDGVDLNRNFETPGSGHAWPARYCCSGSYNGPSSQSEPESQALAKLITEAPTLLHIDVHSYGQVLLGPYSYTTRPHDKKPKIDELGQAMRSAIAKVHGTPYTYATSSLASLAGDVVHGTIADWSTTKGAYGYIYELRPLKEPNPFSPPADQVLPTAEEAIQGIYTALDWAKGGVPH